MNTKLTTVILGIATMGTLLCENAMAQTWQVHPGTNCTVTNDADSEYNTSAIGNPDTDWLRVSCSLNMPNPPMIMEGRVMVKDQNLNDNVNCKLTSVTQLDGSDDVYVFSSDLVSASGYGSAWQTLSFSALASLPLSSTRYTCKIPQSDIGISYIGNYMVKTLP